MILEELYIPMRETSRSTPRLTINILEFTFFFISQTDLTLLSKATIDPMVLSDHNPVSITLDIFWRPEPKT